MYQINVKNGNNDAVRIYSPDRLDDDNRYVDNPILTSEINCADVLEFDLPPDSKGYNLINTLKTVITVYDSTDGGNVNRTRLFRGRAVYIDTLMSGVKHVYCEGDLAYLNDSVVESYQFPAQENVDDTVADLFRQLVNRHNAQMQGTGKEFQIGSITIADKNEKVKVETTTFPTTLEEMQKQLLDEFGGYIIPRCEIENGEEVTYLDYLEDASVENSQRIKFGDNLINISEHSTAEEVFTVLIPLGAAKKREEGELEKRINISSVNGGSKELVDADGVAEFGRIVRVMTWDKIKDPAKLKIKGQKALQRGSNDFTEIELSAVDMHLLEVDASAIRLGEKNKIISPPHGFDKWMPCTKIVLDLENPERSQYFFGRMSKTMSGLNQNTNLKLDSVGYDVDDLGAEIEDIDANKASVNSPDFTGTPTAPTPADGTSDRQIATAEFVYNTIRSNVGNVFSGTTTGSVSVPNNTATVIGSITLTKGAWMIIACCDWAGNGNGYRQIAISSAVDPARSNAATTPSAGASKDTYQQFVKVLSTDGETVNIYARQNSGSAITAYPYIYAIRLNSII